MLASRLRRSNTLYYDYLADGPVERAMELAGMIRNVYKRGPDQGFNALAKYHEILIGTAKSIGVEIMYTDISMGFTDHRNTKSLEVVVVWRHVKEHPTSLEVQEMESAYFNLEAAFTTRLGSIFPGMSVRVQGECLQYQSKYCKVFDSWIIDRGNHQGRNYILDRFYSLWAFQASKTHALAHRKRLSYSYGWNDGWNKHSATIRLLLHSSNVNHFRSGIRGSNHTWIFCPGDLKSNHSYTHIHPDLLVSLSQIRQSSVREELLKLHTHEMTQFMEMLRWINSCKWNPDMIQNPFDTNGKIEHEIDFEFS